MDQGVGVAADAVYDPAAQVRPARQHAATQHDGSRVEQGRCVGDHGDGRRRGVVEDLARSGLSCIGGADHLADVPAVRPRAQRLGRALRDRPAAAVGLEVAHPAARADAAARAVDGVADLARGVAGTPVGLAVGDQPDADPGPEEQAEHRVLPRRVPAQVLAPRARPAVVQQRDRRVHALLQPGAQRKAPERQVGRITQRFAVVAHDPRRPDPHRRGRLETVSATLLEHSLQRCLHALEEGPAIAHGVDPLRRVHAVVLGDQRETALGAAEVAREHGLHAPLRLRLRRTGAAVDDHPRIDAQST